jgi:hypothetical protein
MKDSKCTDPEAVRLWELEAYASGEDLPHVAKHLDHCPACRKRVADYQAWERRLNRILYRFDCPSPDRLRLYHWGQLSSSEQSRIDRHLAVCPPCAAELAEMTEDAETVSESMDRARQAADEADLILARPAAPERQFMPILRGETREVLLFEVDDAALSINLEQEDSGAYTLFGQLLLSNPTLSVEGCARVRPYHADRAPVRSILDVNGGFALPDLLPGTYQLVVDAPDFHIIVPNLTLKDTYD